MFQLHLEHGVVGVDPARCIVHVLRVTYLLQVRRELLGEAEVGKVLADGLAACLLPDLGQVVVCAAAAEEDEESYYEYNAPNHLVVILLHIYIHIY